MHTTKKQKAKELIFNIIGHFYNNKNSRFIYYHDIYDQHKYSDMATPFELFRNHINLVQKEGYQIVDNITEPQNQLRIMFDDGFRGIYSLKDYFIDKKIQVTVFIITSKIGEQNYLSKKEIVELNQTGYFRFSSHTHSHNSLNTMDSTTIKKDMSLSKEILQDLLGNTVNELCYPRGIFSKQIIQIALSIGFDKQFSSIPFNILKQSISPNVYPRILVQNSKINLLKNQLAGVDEVFYKHYLKQHFYD